MRCIIALACLACLYVRPVGATEYSGWATHMGESDLQNCTTDRLHSLSAWLKREFEEMSDFFGELGRSASVEIPVKTSCLQQQLLKRAGADVNIAVHRLYRSLPHGAAHLAMAHETLLSSVERGNAVMYSCSETESKVTVSTATFGPRRFEFGAVSVTEPLIGVLRFKQDLIDSVLRQADDSLIRAIPSLIPSLIWGAFLQAACFRQGGSDCSISVERLSKHPLRYTISSDVLKTVMDELQSHLLSATDTLIAQSGWRSDEVHAVLFDSNCQGPFSVFLPDSLRKRFPTQSFIGEDHGSGGLKSGSVQIDTYLLSGKPGAIEAYDSEDEGFLMCKVASDIAVKEQVHAMKLQMQQAQRMSQHEHDLRANLVERAIREAWRGSSDRYVTCWSLDVPSIASCRDYNAADDHQGTVSFSRLFPIRHEPVHGDTAQQEGAVPDTEGGSMEAGEESDVDQHGADLLGRVKAAVRTTYDDERCYRSSRRGGPGRGAHRRETGYVLAECTRQVSAFVILEADNLINPRKCAEGKGTLAAMINAMCPGLSVVPDGERPYARILVPEHSEDEVRQCIKKLAEELGKRTNVQLRGLRFDSPRF